MARLNEVIEAFAYRIGLIVGAAIFRQAEAERAARPRPPLRRDATPERVLAIVNATPGVAISPADVARTLGLHKDAASVILRRLAARGLIVREGRGSYWARGAA